MNCYHAIYGELLFLTVTALIVFKFWEANGATLSRLIFALIISGIIYIAYVYFVRFFLIAFATGMYARELGTCPIESNILSLGRWGVTLPFLTVLYRFLNPRDVREQTP